MPLFPWEALCSTHLPYAAKYFEQRIESTIYWTVQAVYDTLLSIPHEHPLTSWYSLPFLPHLLFQFTRGFSGPIVKSS